MPKTDFHFSWIKDKNKRKTFERIKKDEKKRKDDCDRTMKKFYSLLKFKFYSLSDKQQNKILERAENEAFKKINSDFYNCTSSDLVIRIYRETFRNTKKEILMKKFKIKEPY